MATPLLTTHEINQAVRAYTLGGSGQPVYCKTPEGYTLRVYGARRQRGTVKVQLSTGSWITPDEVWSAS